MERYGTDPLQHGELRLPPGIGPFPVAVLIHGGCWHSRFETKSGTAPLADALAARGIATWNIEYRQVGNAGAGFPGTFDDVSRGVEHLLQLVGRHPLDLNRVTVVGHSAGAHLALWAASRPKLGERWQPRVRPISVVAIDGPATLAPFVDLVERECGGPVITELMGGRPEDLPEAYRLAQPADHLPLGVRQLLVFGAFGGIMRPYAARARDRGDVVETLQGSESRHFDVITPRTENGGRVVDFIVDRAFVR